LHLEFVAVSPQAIKIEVYNNTADDGILLNAPELPEHVPLGKSIFNYYYGINFN